MHNIHGFSININMYLVNILFGKKQRLLSMGKTHYNKKNHIRSNKFLYFSLHDKPVLFASENVYIKAK